MAVDRSRFPEDVLDVYRRQALEPGALTAMLNYYRANRRVPHAPRSDLERPVTTPTLLIWGEADTALGMELTVGTDRLVSDLTVRYLPGVSHWAQQEAPDVVNDTIVHWLGRAGRRAPTPSTDE
jgi:pimeloyl-ACP methyl ester carboxylesterase